MDVTAIKPSLEGSGLRCTPQRYFDAKGIRHHHFVCDRCGNVEDIEWYDVPRPASGSLGKRILRECELIVRWLCTKCAPQHDAPQVS